MQIEAGEMRVEAAYRGATTWSAQETDPSPHRGPRTGQATQAALEPEHEAMEAGAQGDVSRGRQDSVSTHDPHEPYRRMFCIMSYRGVLVSIPSEKSRASCALDASRIYIYTHTHTHTNKLLDAQPTRP